MPHGSGVFVRSPESRLPSSRPPEKQYRVVNGKLAMNQRISLDEARALDRTDPLAALRDGFSLPEGVIYLDGNSLGPLQHAVQSRMAGVVAVEWGHGLIRSWNTHDWLDLPAKVGAKIAPLIGAPAGAVTVADSTSVNIFKLLAAALAARPDRKIIVTEAGNFPTDLYMAGGIARLLNAGHEVRIAAHDDLPAAIRDDVAIVLLTEVDYRSGRRHDMARMTAHIHKAGALVIWDLCHSAGAFPVDLTSAKADFAVGCGYKYLNGGPGAPAFVYVAPQHLPHLRQPLTGWMGHASPFTFDDTYQPAPSVEAMRVGTPPVLGMSALDAALDVFAKADLGALKQKADRMFDIFASEMEATCPQLEIITPRDPAQRGNQIALRFGEAYAVMQALIARGVIGDFRTPDIIRIGFAPLYVRYEDVVRAAHILAGIMRDESWNRAEFMVRAKVV
jgi:kynureninase